MSARIGFRHCDSRFGFLWLSSAQPEARWHGAGEGPANYFADTPTGAWAEFLRHEGITDAADLAGVRRSLWAVELPEDGFVTPALPTSVLQGGATSYTVCQAAARRLRAAGAERLEAPSAALLPGGASGSHAKVSGLATAAPARDGRVWVLFGDVDVRGWLAVDGGAPPESVLPLVRPLT
ncbi:MULTISPECIES: RES domain-containing protein [Piscinibacter]|uniref:RES domain-containing protein n=1 Tax=Piscinibacter TaxID=1114981 RepID=UPI000FDD5B10|nr:RES domain-containing protein [Piscinibacter defluvii]